MTTLRRQAEEHARRRYLKAWTAAGNGRPAPPLPSLVQFSVPVDAIAPLHSLAFARGDHDDDRYWAFVHHCRASLPHAPNDHLYTRSALPGSGYGWYDVVSGPVAAFWDQRVALLGADQHSFHTQTAADVLNSLISTVHFRIDVFSHPTVPAGVP